MREDVDENTIGKRIILPSNFTENPRYMIQNYQDAMAICKYYGHLNLFITFTCNAQWSEIQKVLNIIFDQKFEDRPYIVSGVFKIKLKALMSDVTKKHYFKKFVAVCYYLSKQNI